MTLQGDKQWQAQAACRGQDTGLFYPPADLEGLYERQAREERAKAVCAGCGVRPRCLEFALGLRDQYGIWGGCNEQERRALLALPTLQPVPVRHARSA
jgi:WhiB family redox-sensing transcriptional regulator